MFRQHSGQLLEALFLAASLVIRPSMPVAEIERAASALRRRLSTALLGARRPDGWLNCTVRPGGLRCREVWSHSQSLYGVLISPDPPAGGKVKSKALPRPVTKAKKKAGTRKAR